MGRVRSHRETAELAVSVINFKEIIISKTVDMNVKYNRSIIVIMPISVNEFHQGNIVDGSSKFVLKFLRSHRDQAFSQDEIINGVNSNPTPESFIHFLAAMAPLQLEGLVERREISLLEVLNCITKQISSFDEKLK